MKNQALEWWLKQDNKAFLCQKHIWPVFGAVKVTKLTNKQIEYIWKKEVNHVS